MSLIEDVIVMAVVCVAIDIVNPAQSLTSFSVTACQRCCHCPLIFPLHVLKEMGNVSEPDGQSTTNSHQVWLLKCSK